MADIPAESTINSLIDIGFNFTENAVIIYHFEVTESHRNNQIGSAVVEVLKQLATSLDKTYLEIRMGGGEQSQKFLQTHNFTIHTIETDVENGLVVGKWETPDL